MSLGSQGGGREGWEDVYFIHGGAVVAEKKKAKEAKGEEEEEGRGSWLHFLAN